MFPCKSSDLYLLDYRAAFAFFLPLTPASPAACLAVSLPKGRRYRISTFHMIDPVNGLGEPYAPGALQFRAGTLEPCILAAHRQHWVAIFDLIAAVGLFALTTLTGFYLVSPYHSSLALSSMQLAAFGTLSPRLRTPSSAQWRHARVGISGNTLSSLYLAFASYIYTQSCDFVSQPTI